MNIGTFNSWNIIALPSTPGFNGITIKRQNTIGSFTSPFSMQSRFQVWTGADLITGHASLPPMNRQTAAAWDAWMAECQGPLNAFYIPMPFDGKRLVAGAPNIGQPIVAGVNTSGSNLLVTKGWPPSMQRLLLPGDYIQVGYRVYTVLDVVVADTGGNSTLTIWPSLREVPGDGTSVIVRNPTGLFRMASAEQQISVDEYGIFHFEFDFAEAR